MFLYRKMLSFMLGSSFFALIGLRTAQAQETAPTQEFAPSANPEVAPVASSPRAADTDPALSLGRDLERHAHRGFYLGVKVGGGYRSFTGSNYQNALAEAWSATGGGVGINVSIGGAIVENLVLHGDLVSSLVSNPTFTVGDDSVETDDVTARLIGFGAGVTYFIMPLNVYVEGTVLASSMNIDQGGEPLAKTSIGIGGIVQAGKQFWISRQWALDVGPSFQLATMRDKDGDGRIVGWAASLLAGASYN